MTRRIIQPQNRPAMAQFEPILQLLGIFDFLISLPTSTLNSFINLLDNALALLATIATYLGTTP